ncbi:MAG: M48 family metalloprotease [Deltaproteobacteria bacterium]|nr:M48 family metalloprotease [Deltaproteobacteria bacterium]
MRTHFSIFITAFVLWGTISCVNLFSLDDDKELGQKVDEEIQANPSEYPILDENEFSEAYDYLEEIRDEILDSHEVEHADDFSWEVKIIDDDDILNAFSVSGGYLYFYTGLIQYLDTEDAFAGVMGHEIAHAAERHVTEALTEQYGLSLLLEAALGDRFDIIQEIAGGLSALAFSRQNESEADELSVLYLSKTRYQCNGAALFFEKLINEGKSDGGTPEFLSTHPNPTDRVEAIHNEAARLDCDTTPSGRDYEAFKEMLE